MAATFRLSPPQIHSILPAFTNKDGGMITVPFNISAAVGASQFNQISMIVRAASTNVVKTTITTTDYYYDYNKRCYMARFRNIRFVIQEGQYYKIQIALMAPNGTLGYYSTIGVAKATYEPTVTIKDRDSENKGNIYTYTGLYETQDPTEKIYNYKFDLFDSANNLVSTSDIQLHNNANDVDPYTGTDTWTIRQALEPNLSYFIQYTVWTVNGLERSSPLYEIIEVQYADPTIHADLSAENNFEEGYVAVKLIGKNDGSPNVNGNFILLRSSSEDNYNTQYELTRFNLNRWDPNTNIPLLICNDHTIQQGYSYRYAIQAYNQVGTYSNRVGNIEGPVECDFEDAFLYDGEYQLKIRFNPKVSSFKNTILETKTDTIGGKHPFVFRNGNVKYKEFSISGLLSMLSDNEQSFIKWKDDSLDDLYDSKYFGPTADNYRRERQFKLTALDWLTNGKPKLFRSAAEGNYIIRLMNVSLSPNDTVGRMLHTFNATAYEVADYTFENLQAFGFALPSYIETRTLQFDSTGTLARAKPSNVITMPQAVIVRIEDAPLAMITYELTDGTSFTMEMPSNGYFEFPKEVLASTPMVKLSCVSWPDGAKITWAYYDAVFADFSYIHKITSTDRVAQILGENEVNFMERLSPDIRTKAGAVHYLKIMPRSTRNIYKSGNKYYANHSMTEEIQFEDYYIYLLVNADGSTTHYIDGRTPKVETPIGELSYVVRLNGSTTLDTSLAGEPLTAAAYQAFTNIQSLSELYLGNGVMADMVYQENILLYAVEVENSPWAVQDVITKKRLWEATPNNTARYQSYLNALTKALDNLREVYDVDFAI